MAGGWWPKWFLCCGSCKHKADLDATAPRPVPLAECQLAAALVAQVALHDAMVRASTKSSGSSAFNPTHWTHVQRQLLAGPRGRDAMRELYDRVQYTAFTCTCTNSPGWQ